VNYGLHVVDEIQWFELCQSRPETKEQTLLCFGELASAFRLLHQFSDEWTDDAVISVIDEMICKSRYSSRRATLHRT